MTLPELERLASEVWESCGGAPNLPRDIEPHLALIAPLFVVSLPSLSAVRVFEWLTDRGLPVPDRDPPSSPLLGCLVAHRGQGAIFLESNLEAAERRVIAAHEFAHFHRDYQAPRTRALRRLGPTILPVLDGLQPPDHAIEFAASLADVPLGIHTHFLEADTEMEERASAFALELLAPRREVQQANVDELIEKWGLPKRWAEGYSRTLAAVAKPFAAQFGL